MEQLNYTGGQLGKYLGNREISSVGKEFIEASKAAFAKSGLDARGVKFVDVKNMSDLNCLDGEIPKIFKKYPKIEKFFKRKLDCSKSQIVKGKNACFAHKANKIFVNTEKMSYVSFHEMGHALNANVGKAGKILMKLRKPGMLLVGVAMLTGIFKRKKVEGEKPQGVVDKVTTFIKDNCGKLTFLGFLPTILEEGLASVKGAKLAKGLLSEKNFKLLNRFNSKSWLTYLGAGIATSVGVTLASKVRDWIAEPKKVAKLPEGNI